MMRFLSEKNYKFEPLKANKLETKELPKGLKINPSVDNKYKDQPLFKEKVERANQILKTVRLPKI